MPAGAEQIASHQNLKTLRQPFEPDWQEIARGLSPDDKLDARSDQKRDDSQIFDASPLYANDDFAAGVFTQATNPANRWFELTVGDKDLAAWPPVKQALYTRGSYLFASLSPAVSNFYLAAPAAFGSLGAFGFGALAQEERIGEGRISDRAIPLGSSYIDCDADGELIAFHNEFMLRGSKLKPFVAQLGGSLPPTIRDDQDYIIVHCVWKNPDARIGLLGWRFMPWRSDFASPGIKDWAIEGGAFENPYHTILWNKRPGRLYPRGPGHVTRPDVNMLNEMERSHIVAAQYGAEPAVLLADEDALSAADVVPNAMLYGGLTANGKRQVEYLERQGSYQLSMQQSQQRRDAIRTAFRFGLMQILKDRPQMTATEFLGFQQQSLELVGPNLICVQIGLSSFIARRYRILERAGQFPPLPPELRNRSLGIEYVSPLARAQKMADARGVIQFQQSLEQMAVTDPQIRDWFDGDKAAPVIGESFTSIPGIVRDPKRVADMRASRAAAQQRAVELEQAEQAAAIGADVAHAAQAATLARGRKPAA